METSLPFLNSPVPSVLAESAEFLARNLSAQRESNPLPVRRNAAKQLLAPLFSLLENRAPEVRNSACKSLAATRFFLNDEACYSSLSSKFDDAKRGRVTEAYRQLQKDALAQGLVTKIARTRFIFSFDNQFIDFRTT